MNVFGVWPGAGLRRRRTLDLPPVHRIRAIEHHDGDLLLRRLLHHVAHRELIGVEANADVLEIHDDGVEAGEGSLDRPPRAALVEQGVNRQARLLILRRRHIVIEHAADAVLGTEERNQLHVGCSVEKIDRRFPVARSAGVIRDEADAFTAKLLEAVAHQDIDAGQNRFRTRVPHGGSRRRFRTAVPHDGSCVADPDNRRGGDRGDAAAEDADVADAVRMQAAREKDHVAAG